jgi:hypothetical protein
MLDVVVLVLLSVVAAEVAWVIRTLGQREADVARMVSEAMEEVVKRQDDRIRKRVSRTEPTEAGQMLDMPDLSNLSTDAIRPGVPIRRQ